MDDALFAEPEPASTGDQLIARVALDVPLFHLDRPFDYLVNPQDDLTAVPGARVRTRFSGRQVEGFILDRTDHTEPGIKLATLQRVVSAEPVLLPNQRALIRATADHYCGTFADVMRLAVPSRHAATEKAAPQPWPEPTIEAAPTTGGLAATTGGAAFLDALMSGGTPRALWQQPPTTHPDGDLATGLLQATIATLRSGRGVLILVPDHGDLTLLHSRLEQALGKRTVAVLNSSAGPAARYRNYLAISRGQARVVVGHRASGYAPVHDLGLVVVVDEGDDLHAESRAPYPHARQVAALRVPIDRCALLLTSTSRSAEAQAWIEAGWLHPLALERSALRRNSPVVKVAADSTYELDRDPRAAQSRLPASVFATIRAGLASGPVLIQVPRKGYLLALRCDRCREPARCQHCHGPLGSKGRGGQLTCGWCGRPAANWRCPTCGGTKLASPLRGSGQTAAEFGRAFPGTAVLESSADHVLTELAEGPRIVIATPGAEPRAASGYAAAVLLDGLQLLERADLRAGEEALRRWLRAASLVRPATESGTVLVVAPTHDRAVNALVRLDPAGFAERELSDRDGAGFPPSVRLVTIDGTPDALTDVIARAELDQFAGAELLGPVDLPPRESGVGGQFETLGRLTVRVPRGSGAELNRRLKAALAQRSARKLGAVRVRVDPAQLG